MKLRWKYKRYKTKLQVNPGAFGEPTYDGFKSEKVLQFYCSKTKKWVDVPTDMHFQNVNEK